MTQIDTEHKEARADTYLAQYTVTFTEGDIDSDSDSYQISPEPSATDNVAIREIAGIIVNRHYYGTYPDECIADGDAGFGLFLQSRLKFYVRGSHIMEITPSDENIRDEVYTTSSIPVESQISEWLWQWSVYESSYNPQFTPPAKIWMAVAAMSESEVFQIHLYKLSDEKLMELPEPEVYKRIDEPETFWLKF